MLPYGKKAIVAFVWHDLTAPLRMLFHLSIRMQTTFQRPKIWSHGEMGQTDKAVNAQPLNNALQRPDTSNETDGKPIHYLLSPPNTVGRSSGAKP